MFGGLAIAGMLAQGLRGVLPYWAAVPIVLMPFALVAFVRPGEWSDRVVWAAHFAASVWYLLVAGVALTAWLWRGPHSPGWQVPPTVAVVGTAPCVAAMFLACRAAIKSLRARRLAAHPRRLSLSIPYGRLAR